MPDKFTVEILPDGTLKLETGKVSAPNHINAESFLREVQKLAGGPVKVTARHPHSHHGHEHSHGEEAHQH